ncbi:Reverse transcriptase zinc-binding domain [Macleaya cordata]|uniref:Reverse transcriptase zinc-binding domain n=1 Tax=Macleaya cordata TaxID=56857 RepID=A0A200QEN3_MACCD|nr:Reverse transcriptase zinc-binding domain [Macleaya cordata]
MTHSGSKISFWYDFWKGSKPLKAIAPALFKLSTAQSGSIADFIVQSTHGKDWNLALSRDPKSSEIPELLSLLQIIGLEPPTTDSLEDQMVWSLTKTGQYTVKSAYDHLTANDVSFFPTKQIWFNKIPLKISFFMWTSYFNKILTLDNLKKRGHHLPNACYFCLKHEETSNHILLHCQLTKEIWAEILPRKGWCWPFPESLALFIHGWNSRAVWSFFFESFDLVWCIPYFPRDVIAAWGGVKFSNNGKILWSTDSSCYLLVYMEDQERDHFQFQDAFLQLDNS